MPSRALQEWRTTQRAELDRMERAIVRTGRRSPEERALRQHLVDAAILLLAAHFQHGCRELHSEASEFLAGRVQPATLSRVVAARLVDGRALSRGNAQPSTLAADFRRFNLAVWDELAERDRRNETRQAHLDRMNRWRNAIAHRDFDAPSLREGKETGRSLASFRTWRRSCSALLHDLDAVVKRHLTEVAGSPPW